MRPVGRDHTLAVRFCRQLGALPLVAIPKGVRMQLLDPGEVAQHMAGLVQGPPSQRVPDMGGPEALSIDRIPELLGEIDQQQRSVYTLCQTVTQLVARTRVFRTQWSNPAPLI